MSKQMQLFKTISDVELVYRKAPTLCVDLLKSEDAVAPAREAIPAGQINLREYFGILLVSRGNRIVKRSIIGIGGMNSVTVDVRLIMMTALLSGTDGIVLFHNHPSSGPKPSENDIRLTRRIYEAGRILDITVLDHIILTETDYYSFADQGML